MTVLLFALVGSGVAEAGYAVSSFKKNTRGGANLYNAASALDGNADTCWAVDPDQPNEGQWIELDVPVGSVDKIGMVVGFDKDDATFKDYARIKEATVTVVNLADNDKVVLTHDVKFEDKRGWQVVDIPDTKVGGEIAGGRVRVTVKSVYPGKDYSLLAVSDVLVHLKDFDAASTALEEPPPALQGFDADKMLDGNTRTFWAGSTAEDNEFSVSASGYGVSKLGISQGPRTHKRPKTVKVEISDNTVEAVLADKPGMQWVQLPALVGYTGSAWGTMKVTVVDSYPGSKADNNLAISELKVKATNVDDF